MAALRRKLEHNGRDRSISEFGQERLLSIPLFALWLCFRTSIDIDRYFCFLQ